MKASTSLAAALLTCTLVGASSAQVQGPSSSAAPYVTPVAAGVQTVSVLTVGDMVGGYRMVGIPDGLGARKLPANQFGLVMNHELSAAAGVVRAHGATGAFVSTWEIDRNSLQVHSGADLVQTLHTVTGGQQLNRLCSGDQADRRAFWLSLNPTLAPHIFMSGEESGAEGRAFAHIVTGPDAGQSYELPALGNLSWENVVARPLKSRLTVVAGLDDSTPGQVYFYIGEKKRLGDVVTRAGLGQGSLYGVRVPGAPLEDRTNGVNGVTTFELADLGDVSGKTGAQIQADSVASGVTEFLRPEDGAWDPIDPSNFYFVTTDRFNTTTTVGRSRLWRLHFTNPFAPELGGTIEMLLDGTEGQQMMDNLAVDTKGHVIIQEDPGNQVHQARIWQYTIATDELKLIAEASSDFFTVGGANFLTQDEETSGIIDASSLLGPGWFLFVCQAHYSIPGELAEGGQLLALFNPDSQ